MCLPSVSIILYIFLHVKVFRNSFVLFLVLFECNKSLQNIFFESLFAVLFTASGHFNSMKTSWMTILRFYDRELSFK